MRPHTPCTNSSNAPLAAPLDHPTHIAGTRTFHRFHHNHHTPLTFSIGHFSGAATARCSQLYPFLGPLPTPWLLRTLRPLPPLPRSIPLRPRAPNGQRVARHRCSTARRGSQHPNTVCASPDPNPNPAPYQVEVPAPETPKRASAAAELPQTEVRTKRTCAGRKAAAK